MPALAKLAIYALKNILLPLRLVLDSSNIYSEVLAQVYNMSSYNTSLNKISHNVGR